MYHSGGDADNKGGSVWGGVWEISLTYLEFFNESTVL